MDVDEVTQHAARMGTALGAVDVGANILARVASEIPDDDLQRIASRLSTCRTETHAACKIALDRLLDGVKA